MNNRIDFFGGLINLLIVGIPVLVIGGIWWLFGTTAVVIALLLCYVLFATRIITRHTLYWPFRKSQMGGELKWIKIKPDNRRKTQDQLEQTHRIVSNAQSVFDTLVASHAQFHNFDRGHISIIWEKRKPKKDGQAGQVICYMGLPANRINNNGLSTLNTLATSMGATLSTVRNRPKFKVNHVKMARLVDMSMAEVTDGKKTVLNPVVDKIMDSEMFSGIVVMSLERMDKRFEDGMWKKFTMQSASAEVGSSMEFNSVMGTITSNAMGNAFRSCVGVASYDGNKNKSMEMLNTVLTSLNESPVKADRGDPWWYHNWKVFGWGVALAGLEAALFATGLISMVPFLVLLAATLIFAVSGVLQAGWLGRTAVVSEFRKGNIVPPPFLIMSPRRWGQKLFNFYKPSAGSGEATRNRFAIPSDKQVLPLHGTPIASFLIPPEVESDREIDASSLPEVGVSSKHLSSMTKDDLFIGMAGKKDPFYYPIDKIQFPLFTAGGMGSGKTNFLQVLYMSVAFQSTLFKHRGDTMKITPIWGETKGQGAYDTWDLVRGLPGAAFLDINNPEARIKVNGKSTKFRLALEGPRLGEEHKGRVTTPADVVKNVGELMVALKSKWGDGAIGARSDAALSAGFHAAMLLTPDEIRSLQVGYAVDPNRPNIIKLCNILLGNVDQVDLSGRVPALLQEFTEAVDSGQVSTTSREAHLRDALNTLVPYVDKKNQAHRQSRQDALAPKNKLEALAGAGSYWEPSVDRQDIYIGQIVEWGAPVVINTGASLITDADGKKRMDKPFRDDISVLLLGATTYAIWGYIKEHGVGWEKKGVRVMQFYDEVSHIASDTSDANSDDVVSIQVNEGRAFGDSLNMATQNFSRLDPGIADQVMMVDTKIWFKQNGMDMINKIYDDLGEDNRFSKGNLEDLEVGTGIAKVQTRVGKAGPFVLHVPEASVWRDLLKSHKNMQKAAVAWCNSRQDDVASADVFDHS